MLPNLSSLTLAPDGPCRPCGPRRPAATGVIYGAEGWQLEPCPICFDPLGEDSEANPWAPNQPPYAGPCCVNEHAYHKGCIQEVVNRDANARCPECREPILPDLLAVPPAPGTFASPDDLQAAVMELLALDPTGATPHPVHGPIGGWDVSRVIDMNFLFFRAAQFNQPLNGWNVSNVETMEGMFEEARAFNQPLNSWNVSNVETMEGMFQEATAFNQPLNSWNVSNVGTMRLMFREAAAFNQPLNSWVVINVDNMDGMFDRATSFNQPLSGWNVSTVMTMKFMFYRATSFNQPLDAWDVSNVQSMYGMFEGANTFNQDLCSWKARYDVNTTSMFLRATAFNNDPTTRPPNCPGVFAGREQLKRAIDDLLALDPTGATPHPVHGPIGGWDVSRVIDMNFLFFRAAQFNQPLNGWDVSNVETMEGVFEAARAFNQPLNTWVVSNVRHMDTMFRYAASFNQPLDEWVVSKVQNMRAMFLGAEQFNQPLNSWNVSNVRNMNGMFEGATSFNQDLCSWIVQDDASIYWIFDGADAFNRDPATRPPRRMSEANAGRNCPSLPRGLTRQRSERDGSPAARQRTGAAVGVALEDKRKLEAWYESSRPNLPFDRMSAMFLVGAVLARIREVYGAEGKERVEAGIKHFLDDNDVLTVLSVLNDPGADPAATKIAQRVQLAFMNEALREKQEEEAKKVVDTENKKLAEDDQIVEGQVQGGGKCMFEIGRTKGSLKEEAGGSTCVRRQQSMQTIAEARRTLEMARERTRFPASLW